MAAFGHKAYGVISKAGAKSEKSECIVVVC